MSAYLSLAVAVAAVITFFTSQTAFWFVSTMGVVLLGVTGWRLKRLPRLELDGLSAQAAQLLAKYNHAWAAAALTRTISLSIGVWQLIFIAAGLYYVFHGAWLPLAVVAAFFCVISYVAGEVNPQMYIRSKGLVAEHDEIVDALTERFAERTAKRIAAYEEALRDQRRHQDSQH